MSAMYIRNAKIIFAALAAIIAIAGCAQAPPNVKPIAKTEHPAALMDQLNVDLGKARKERVDLLSPTWFADAQSSYNRAKAQLDKGAQISGILEHIAMGQAQLAQARKFAEQSQKSLSKVIESRDAAIKAGADKYAKEFKPLENDFNKLTRAVEGGDAGYVAKRKSTLNNQYRELELRAIKDAALAEARKLIRTAEARNLGKVAPKSLLIAKSKLVDADGVITKDRYNRKDIDKAVAEAEFFGRRVHQIALASKKLDTMEPEDIALWMEGFFAQTTMFLKVRDSRDMPFKEQQKVILGAVTELQRDQSSASNLLQTRNREIDKLNKRVDDLEGVSYQERADKERLAAEKRFNELYNKVQGYFSPQQAEVYKKSQHLVIRLKAMQFPVGQSVIVPDNYPLLNTVQRAIKTFQEPDVVIEGHSDSTGSEANNLTLSQKRAESVRQYFIYNGVLPAKRITAKGYGSSRPLASNATAKGRAINRRIDVIVKPVRR